MSEGHAASGWALLRHGPFSLLLTAKLFSTLAFQMIGVAVGWQVYQITGDPLDLGWVGFVQFVPILVLGIFGGHVADNFNRVRVLSLSLVLVLACSIALTVLALDELRAIWPILLTLATLSISRAFYSPASQALLPNIVSRQELPNAVAWTTSIFQIGTIAGPAIAGLILLFGTMWVYAAAAALCAVSLLLTMRIKAVQPPARGETANLRTLTSGLSYVWRNKIILGAISLDLAAVLVGGVTALLPIFAADILGVGPAGYGVLRSAPAIGALLTGLVLAQRPIRTGVGKAMFAAVALYGVATLIFGLSSSFELSVAMLAMAGAADMVSVFVRHNLIQLATPDHMRGRVAAVSSVFITGSNELGEFESGAVAALIGVVPCVVVGAGATLVITALWWRMFPALRKVSRPDDAAESTS
jgi:MFS family permease